MNTHQPFISGRVLYLSFEFRSTSPDFFSEDGDQLHYHAWMLLVQSVNNLTSVKGFSVIQERSGVDTAIILELCNFSVLLKSNIVPD